jgi:hypothetical protein
MSQEGPLSGGPSSMGEMMKRTMLTSAALVLVAGFGACAVVLAGPVTPIKFDVGPVASLLNPHLSQNWQLFAPDPISDERGVVVKLRCGDEETKWIDISSSSIARTQSSRFFPDRESRIISNALMERFAQDDITRRLATRHQADLLPTDEASKNRAERVLARYAARVVACESGRQPSAVRLRYVTRSLPPWSKRGDDAAKGDPRVLDSGWIVL